MKRTQSSPSKPALQKTTRPAHSTKYWNYFAVCSIQNNVHIVKEAMVYSFSHWLYNVKRLLCGCTPPLHSHLKRWLMPTVIDTFWKLYWYRNDM